MRFLEAPNDFKFMFSHKGTEAQRIYFLESLDILSVFVRNKFYNVMSINPHKATESLPTLYKSIIFQKISLNPNIPIDDLNLPAHNKQVRITYRMAKSL
jgi:hypothetical protein